MADEFKEITDAAEKALEKRMAKVYEEAYRDISKKLAAYIESAEPKWPEMIGRMQSGEITRDEYMAFAQRTLLGGQRLVQLQQSIVNELVNADKIAVDQVNEHAKEMYAAGINYGTYQVEHDAQVSTSFSLYDKKLVEKLVEEEPNLLPTKEINGKKEVRWNAQHVDSAITQGIIQGESIEGIARRLQNVVGMDYRASVRNARTATVSASNKGKLDSYDRAKQMGIKLKKQWMATFDEKTRDTHRELDGQIVENEEPFVTMDGVELMFPADPDCDEPGELYNCRCRMRAVIDGLNEDSYDWRHDVQVGDQSYDEWKEGHATAAAAGLPEESGQAVDVTPESISEMVERIKAENEAAGIDHPTEAQIMEVGKKVAEDYHAAAPEGRTEAQQAIDAQQALIDKTYKEFDEISAMRKRGEFASYQEYADTWNAKVHEFDAMRAEYRAMKDNMQAETASWLSSYLSGFREIGGVDTKQHYTTNSPVIKVLNWAYEHYPTDWVQASVDFRLYLSPKKTSGRGFYQNNGVIAIDGSTVGGQRETSIHELGHRLEHVMPWMMQAERDFYNRRTLGEPLVWLGPGYKRNELARRDDFIDPYMGKDYGGDGYELVSMGFQYAYCEPEKLATDPDMEAWIYGLLAIGG